MMCTDDLDPWGAAWKLISQNHLLLFRRGIPGSSPRSCAEIVKIVQRQEQTTFEALSSGPAACA